MFTLIWGVKLKNGILANHDCDDNENASPNKRFNKKNNGSARAF